MKLNPYEQGVADQWPARLQPLPGLHPEVGSVQQGLQQPVDALGEDTVDHGRLAREQPRTDSRLRSHAGPRSGINIG